MSPTRRPARSAPFPLRALFRPFCLVVTLVVGIAHADSTVAADVPPPGYTLAWSDEFDGEHLDTAKWFVRADRKMRSIQRAENVSLNGGHLVIDLKKLDQPEGAFTASGGGVVSRQRFKYGYYEARARLGDGVDDDKDGRADEGWHHSFWCQMAVEDPKAPGTVNTSYPPERRTEIDCFENASTRDDHDKGDEGLHRFTQHVIVWKPDDKGHVKEWGRLPKPPGDVQSVPEETANDWHTYGFEWTPEYVQFYVDGKPTKRAAYSVSKFEHTDINIWLTAIAASWSGPDIEESAARYDYVRYYAPPAPAK